MAGRIRTIKPEWLEDDRSSAYSDQAARMSIALILLADDYGRGRARVGLLAGQVWPDSREGSAKVLASLCELETNGFVFFYCINSQQYYEIVNWSKHQKIDHPGKPRIPSSCGANRISSESLANTSRDSLDTVAPDLIGDRGPGNGPDPDPDPRAISVAHTTKQEVAKIPKLVTLAGSPIRTDFFAAHFAVDHDAFQAVAKIYPKQESIFAAEAVFVEAAKLFFNGDQKALSSAVLSALAWQIKAWRSGGDPEWIKHTVQLATYLKAKRWMEPRQLTAEEAERQAEKEKWAEYDREAKETLARQDSYDRELYAAWKVDHSDAGHAKWLAYWTEQHNARPMDTLPAKFKKNFELAVAGKCPHRWCVERREREALKNHHNSPRAPEKSKSIEIVSNSQG